MAVIMILGGLPLRAPASTATDTFDGPLMTWGRDDFGELGDGGFNAAQGEPVPILSVADLVGVAAGNNHSLALDTAGRVWAWGADHHGQLGDGGDNANQSRPVMVLGEGSGVVAVAAGAAHSLALRADGSVVAWGDDLSGQLGDGGPDEDRSTPVPVSGLSAGSGVVALAAGAAHSLALRSDGSVLAWGSDGNGQLGDGGLEGVDQPTPVAVGDLGPGSGVTGISAGAVHSLAVRADGSVLAWGSDNDGQVGDGGGNSLGRSVFVPVQVSGLGAGSGVTSVAAGAIHSLALRADGSVVGWGSDYYGQLGDGGFFLNRATPVATIGLGPGSGVVGLAAGGEHSLARRSDGSVVAWGGDRFGQLGDGGPDSFFQTTPVDVNGLGPGSGVTAVAAGGGHSLAAGRLIGSTYAPISPRRVWDTRVGPGPTGRIGPGQTREVVVAGTEAVPSGVTAVVLNVTAVGPTAGTFVTVWPTGEARPVASNLNVPPGDTRANLVTVKVRKGGRVSFYNQAGTTDLVVDVAGWYGTAGGHRYTGVTPFRLWDSRGGPGQVGRIGPGSTRTVKVTGVDTVPDNGVTAVVLNVTAISPTAGTYLTAWPTGEERPVASNLNLPANDIRPNLVIAKVGAGGQVSFFNESGTVDVAVDVAGYFSPFGVSLRSISPTRVYDSRLISWLPRPGPGSTQVRVAGVPGVPASATSVVLNVTAVGPTAETYVTVWPGSQPRPLASNLNIPPGDTRANVVIVGVDGSGRVNLYNHAGTVDLVVDVAGWYGSFLSSTG